MAWYNPTDPTQRNWMLGGLVCLIVIVPFRMYVLDDMQVENEQTLEHVERLEALNSRARVLAQRGEGELEERMALYERHVAKLEELIPGREEIAALLDDINNRARSRSAWRSTASLPSRRSHRSSTRSPRTACR